MENAIVIVLGDIGHSPRTCYHALSLAERNIPVELVGYMESVPHQKIMSNPLITIVPLWSPPRFMSKLPSILSLMIKCFWLSVVLPLTLFFRTSMLASVVMVQNPPGVPTLFFAWIASKLKRGHLIIDWHNYSSSMIRYNYKLDDQKEKGFVKSIISLIAGLIGFFEGFFGRIARWNICVSNGMRDDLRRRWKVKAITTYDRPQSWNILSFDEKKKHEFYMRLLHHPDFNPFLKREPRSIFKYDYGEVVESTLFSYLNVDGTCHLRLNRPLLLISSTSWTEEEDFGILLDALHKYDTVNIRNKCELPDFFVVITGKGPLKQFYLEKIQSKKWNHVTIVTPWLAAEDYPKMLACADLGVSLHASTSGLDLPMKVVDMLGCKVPVLAKQFPTIGELVTPRNGRTFESSQDLYRHFLDLASGFPQKSSALTTLKNQILENGQIDWDCQWNATFWPLLHGLMVDSLNEIQRQQRFADNSNYGETISD
uniref:Chitobiosyldiphosphodolichol beta-mannosyltransferase n=1 Tax=Panagrolaimus sp. JU765 TaxID=591449 RepID=A0AC34Q1Q3_9BILA